MSFRGVGNEPKIPDQSVTVESDPNRYRGVQKIREVNSAIQAIQHQNVPMSSSPNRERAERYLMAGATLLANNPFELDAWTGDPLTYLSPKAVLEVLNGSKTDRDIPYRVAKMCLLYGSEEMRQAINGWLLTKKAPVNKGFLDGHYDDFTTTSITRLVYECSHRLEDRVLDHLIHNVLKLEGEKPKLGQPLFWDFVHIARNSENHDLMIIGGQYLKNKLLQLERNDLKGCNNELIEKELISILKEMLENGLREYNSIPYIGYTASALLNLYDFGEGEVKALAKEVLDKMFTEYALSSSDYKIFADFRRQSKKLNNQDLMGDHSLEPFLRVWQGADLDPVMRRHGKRIADAMTTSYRPPAGIMQPKEGVYVAKRCNESILTYLIFSIKKFIYKIFGWEKPLDPVGGTFISARSSYYVPGGAKRSFVLTGGTTVSSSMIKWPAEQSGRTPTLLTEAKATDIQHVAHLGHHDVPIGEDANLRNNTCIYSQFMSGSAPIILPYSAKVVAGSVETGAIIEIEPGLRAFVLNGEDFGVMALLPNTDPDKSLITWHREDVEGLLLEIQARNPSLLYNQNQFTFPEKVGGEMAGRTISFDIHAKRDTWGIQSIDEAALNRDGQTWNGWLTRIDEP